MDNQAYIRFIDAHAESRGCYHDAALSAHERLLIPFALFIGQIGAADGDLAGVPRLDQIINGIGVLLGVAVDDAGTITGFHVTLEQVLQFLLTCLLRDKGIGGEGELGAIEADRMLADSVRRKQFRKQQ